MKNPFGSSRFCEETIEETLKSLRYTVRELARHGEGNPFARPLPCPVGGTAEEPRGGVVLRVF